MSLEQSINDHAAAIRELAAAIIGATVAGEGRVIQAPTGKSADKVLAEVLTEATQESGAKKPTTAKEAVAEALEKAKAAKEEKATAESEAAEEVKEYNYEKDVAPALTQYLKTKGRDAGVALLAKYGAKNGQGVKKEDYAAIMAEMVD